MKFDLSKFYRFCNYLQIDTKEQGRIRLGANIKGTQKYLFNEIAKGLDEDIHFYVVLKGRQAMITTAMEALDLYWLFKYPGLQGTLVTDTDDNKAKCRSELSLFMESLPDNRKVGVSVHNRTMLELENRSRLFYQTAGTRGNKFLGQGKGLNFCHATEAGSYGSEEGIMSLLASFAQTHEQRLFVFESTAHGFNHYEDMWQNAKRAKAQRAIFIGWWLNELYQIPSTSTLYHSYWDGKATGEEKEWMKDVYTRYGFKITSNQLAWWRQRSAEEYTDLSIQYQNFPPTENYAFIATGTLFFSNSTLTDATKRAKRALCETFRFSFGLNFADTKLVRANQQMAQLLIWEHPVEDGQYAIGCDPAYGSSVYADRFCIQVFRCYADGIDQVAEFATASVESYQFAWVIAALAGLYRNVRINLEMNSCGGAVYNEMKNLKRQVIAMPPGDNRSELFDVVGAMRFFMWQSDDNISGPTNSIGWVTNERNKASMLYSFRDLFELKRMNLYSVELLNEMRSLEQVEGSIAAEGRNKDDRVMAAGLAIACYVKKVLPGLINRRLTREKQKIISAHGLNPQQEVMERSINHHLDRIGLGSKRIQ